MRLKFGIIITMMISYSSMASANWLEDFKNRLSMAMSEQERAQSVQTSDTEVVVSAEESTRTRPVWDPMTAVDQINKEIQARTAGATANKATPYTSAQVSSFITNLTAERTKAGSEPPIYVGASQVISETSVALSNPDITVISLVGDPGVGKTAIADYMAATYDGTILQLNLGSFLATENLNETRARIEFLKRLLELAPKDVVLFVDEFHMIMKEPELANMFKEGASKGKLRAMFSTTLDEHRVHIEPERAFSDREHSISIENPTEQKVLTALRMKREYLETKIGIDISDDALKETARLVFRYYSNQSPFRMAYRLLTNTLARMNKERINGPQDKSNLLNRIQSLEAELKSNRLDQLKILISDEVDGLDRKSKTEARQIEIEQELKILRQRAFTMDEAQKIGILRSELFRKLQDLTYRNADLELQTDLKSQIVELNKRLAEIATRDAEAAKVGKNQSFYLTEAEMRRTVAFQKGIPLEFVGGTESERLGKLEARLNSRVINQPVAIKEIVRSLVIRQGGLKAVTGPIGVIMLDGSSGGGKTYLAKMLQEFYYGEPDGMLRISGEEYSGEHSETRLVGSGAGWTGNDQKTALEPIRDNPFRVVLIDEIEKMHQKVRQKFLRAMDEGWMEDANGRKLDFRNTVFVITTNTSQVLGRLRFMISEMSVEERKYLAGKWNTPEMIAAMGLTDLMNLPEDGKLLVAQYITSKDEKILTRLQNRRLQELGFATEFIGRLSANVIVNTHSPETAKQIVKSAIDLRVEYVKENFRVQLVYDDAFLDAVRDAGFSDQGGVRPIAKAIDRLMEEPLAKAALAGDFPPGSVVQMSGKSTESHVHVEHKIGNKSYISDSLDKAEVTSDRVTKLVKSQMSAERIKALGAQTKEVLGRNQPAMSSDAASVLDGLNPGDNAALKAASNESAIAHIKGALKGDQVDVEDIRRTLGKEDGEKLIAFANDPSTVAKDSVATNEARLLLMTYIERKLDNKSAIDPILGQAAEAYMERWLQDSANIEPAMRKKFQETLKRVRAQMRR